MRKKLLPLLPTFAHPACSGMTAYVIGAPAGYIDAQSLDIEITMLPMGWQVARWNGQTKGLMAIQLPGILCW